MGFFKKVFSNPLSIAAVANPAALLGAATTAAAGGGLDYLAAEKDRKAQSDAASAANAHQMAVNDKNIQMQLDFAKNGIRWRVDDAIAAGLHPLAALGASTVGFSPVSTAFAGGSPTSSAGNAYRFLSGMSQNVARAINATRTNEEKTLANLELERAKLQNDYIKSQIAESQARVASQGMQPGLPTFSGHPESEKGLVPEYAWSSAGPGRLGIQPSNEIAMKNSSNFLYMLFWELRKRFDPPSQPSVELKKQYPYYDAFSGTYRTVPPAITNPLDASDYWIRRLYQKLKERK